MRTKYFFILLAIIVSMVSCRHHSTRIMLVEVDTLLAQKKKVEALDKLNNIMWQQLSTEELQAYYALLHAQASYPDDTTYRNIHSLDSTVAYYERVGIPSTLGRAYFEKGRWMRLWNHPNQAVLFFKKAEATLDEKTDFTRAFQTKMFLSRINLENNETELAHGKAREAMAMAFRSKNANFINAALSYISFCYWNEGRKDSALYYIGRAKAFIDQVPKHDQAGLLTNEAKMYTGTNDQLAEADLRSAIAIYPLPETYSALADIYVKQGKASRADSLWQRALQNGNASVRSEVMEQKMASYSKAGDYARAYAIAHDLLALRDSMNRAAMKTRVGEVQLKYDHDREQLHLERLIIIVVSMALLLTLLAIIIWVYYRYRSVRTRERMLEDLRLIEEYKRQLGQLSDKSETMEGEVAALRHKLIETQDRQSAVFFNGRTRYNEVLDDKPIVLWRKKDITDFIEYYRMIDLPFIHAVENGYDGLSAKNTIFLILEHINKTDEQKEAILGVSPSTIRSMRSRIKAKKRLKEN